MTEHFCLTVTLTKYTSFPTPTPHRCTLTLGEREGGRQSIYTRVKLSPSFMFHGLHPKIHLSQAREGGEAAVYFPAVSMETAEQIVVRPGLSFSLSLSLFLSALSHFLYPSNNSLQATAEPHPHNKGVTGYNLKVCVAANLALVLMVVCCWVNNRCFSAHLAAELISFDFQSHLTASSTHNNKQSTVLP